jgi:hypothetical protein
MDILPSTGTSLLDYKRGTPVERPHGGLDGRRGKEGGRDKTLASATTSMSATTFASATLKFFVKNHLRR